MALTRKLVGTLLSRSRCHQTKRTWKTNNRNLGLPSRTLENIEMLKKPFRTPTITKITSKTACSKPSPSPNVKLNHQKKKTKQTTRAEDLLPPPHPPVQTPPNAPPHTKTVSPGCCQSWSPPPSSAPPRCQSPQAARVDSGDPPSQTSKRLGATTAALFGERFNKDRKRKNKTKPYHNMYS